ncbi:C-type lectin domain family 4 member D [Aphelenchoides avenae]|nr:C-type lectin domain family 4 member D [Aphelenchus avenae]
MLPEQRTWNDAASTCDILGATLVTIPDYRVDNALQQFALSRATTFHIGLRYDEASWEWRWPNSRRMTYAYWGIKAMGSVQNPAGKECATAMFDPSGLNMNRQPHAEWQPVSCGFKAPAVCEIRLNDRPVHTPSPPAPVGIGSGAGPIGIGSGAGPNSACKDTSSYQCSALKAIMCNDAQYAKYVAENCAQTCGLC